MIAPPLPVVRACFLYVPLVACAAVVLVKRPSKRELAGALLALLWTMPALLALEVVARRIGWWRMSAPAGVFPIAADVWFGWAIAWGPLPALIGWRRPLAVLAFAWWLDVTLMPAALHLVTLGHAWLVGEIVALTVVLLPGVLLTRWTIRRRFLKVRAAMQMAVFGVWTIGIVPYAAERIRPSAGEPIWWALPVLAPFGLVAASAVQEFVRRGNGTPYPYDPPERLVTSGPYAYATNPMQLSMTIVLLGLAAIMRNPLLALAALLATAYGSGLAAWHESVTTAKRFGPAWSAYRASVRAWVPGRRPYVERESVVYIASTCDLCSGVGGWIARRRPLGLRIEAAETLADPPRRMLYVPSDGGPSDSGIAAFGRCLEHVNAGWAVLGFALRLPVLRPVIHVFVDACGGGPRVITSDEEGPRVIGSHAVPFVRCCSPSQTRACAPVRTSVSPAPISISVSAASTRMRTGAPLIGRTPDPSAASTASTEAASIANVSGVVRPAAEPPDASTADASCARPSLSSHAVRTTWPVKRPPLASVPSSSIVKMSGTDRTIRPPREESK